MGSIVLSPSQILAKVSLETEQRDIKDIWNSALIAYRDILGENLQQSFSSVDDMIKNGVDHLNNFHHFRHNETKIDKLRGLFMKNIDLIGTGAQKLINAASPAFPPAAAIATALTFVLAACKSVSADYDVVTAFFEDMNNFLQRLSILEGRLPDYRAYQACLLDVFTSFLKMCAIANKFIRQGRLKKWVINAFTGQDSDLISIRKGMSTGLDRLQSATEFAVLANTESIETRQRKMQTLQAALQENQTLQIELIKGQIAALNVIQHDTAAIQADMSDLRSDIKAVLVAFTKNRNAADLTGDADARTRRQSNRVRAVIKENQENIAQLEQLASTHIPALGQWFFEDSRWQSWSAAQEDCFLLVEGPNGSGKSHLSYAVYDHLRKLAYCDPNGFSIVTYFSFDNTMETTRSFESMIDTIVLQISENLTLRERLDDKFSNDGQKIPKRRYFSELITPCFNKSSRYSLTIIIDNLDEIEEKSTRSAIVDLIDSLRRQKLRIKIIATNRCRDPITSITMSRSKNEGWAEDLKVELKAQSLSEDIKVFVTNRLQSEEDAHLRMAGLGKSMKRRVIYELSEKAPDLLYADLALTYLSGIGREAAVARELDIGLPESVNVLFERMLKACRRRMPQDLERSVQLVLKWMTYSFQPLTLSQGNYLTQKAASQGIVRFEEEIFDIFHRFLRIRTIQNRLGRSTSEILSEGNGMISEDDIQIAFRHRSMKQFFLCTDMVSWRRQDIVDVQTEQAHHGRTSQAHREMFLECCSVLSSVIDDKQALVLSDREKLKKYAVTHCFRHWQNIESKRHTKAENLAVCRAFYGLITDRHGFPTALEANGSNLDITQVLRRVTSTSDDLNTADFFTAWRSWSVYVKSLDARGKDTQPIVDFGNDTELLAYWRGDPLDALLPLFRSHLLNWLKAGDRKSVCLAYAAIRRVLNHTTLKSYLSENISDIYNEYLAKWPDSSLPGDPPFDDSELSTEVCRIRSAYNDALSIDTHFSTAVIFTQMCEVDDLTMAELSEMEESIKRCTDTDQQLSGHIRLADCLMFFRMCCDFGSDLDKELVDRAWCHISHSMENITNTSPLLSLAMRVKADAMLAFAWENDDRGDITEALGLCQRLRDLGEEGVFYPCDLLDKEMGLCKARKDHERLISWFLRLSLQQRLLLVTNAVRQPYLTADPLLKAALATGRLKELQMSYVEIIECLDLVGYGNIWRDILIQHYFRACGDMTAAMEVLRQAFDLNLSQQEIKFGDYSEDAAKRVAQFLNLAVDLLYQLFKVAKDPGQKAVYLEEADALLSKPLPQSVQISKTMLTPHLLVVAKMKRRLGHLQQYQELLQRLFEIGWTNLHDDFISNDMITLRCLAKVVAQIPSMQHESRIINSSQLYLLGTSPRSGYSTELDSNKYSEYDSLVPAETKDGPDIDLFPKCAGFNCTRLWKSWFLDSNSGTKVMYTCLQCASSDLCQLCYEKRMELNRQQNVEKEVEFCCSGGEYIKTPMDGWKGIRNGFIEIEGEEPLEFSMFLEQVRDKWHRAWDDFWSG